MAFRENLCGNLRIVCGEPAESSFGNAQNRLSGTHGIIFLSLQIIESAKSSSGVLRTTFQSPEIIEPEKSSSGVLRTVFGNLNTIQSAKSSSGSFITLPQSTGDCANLHKSLCNLLRMFCSSPSVEHSAGTYGSSANT